MSSGGRPFQNPPAPAPAFAAPYASFSPIRSTLGNHRNRAILQDMIDANLISKVKELTPAERLEFIEAVWETMGAEDVPVTAAEQSLLDARIADAENNPDDESAWSDVHERLQHRLP